MYMKTTIKRKVHRKNKTIKNCVHWTEKQFNSGDGMLTYVWGPPMWHFLHTMSFNYPVHPTTEQKHQYRDFILSLKNILPCGKCRTNLKKNFKIHPLLLKDLENRETFSYYIYKLHEVVNCMLKKTSGLSYDDVRERYEHFRARCAMNEHKTTENGCVEPLYGDKSKCLLKIVPLETQCDTLEIDEKCFKRPLSQN